MLKLPSAGQSFAQIRRGNFLYVDKTRYLHEMVTDGGCYFLSRPPRFGKTLLIGALAELMKGNRELFKGLWIDSSNHDFKQYPVISLTMVGSLEGKNPVEKIIKSQLFKAAEANSVDPNSLIIMKSPRSSDILAKLVVTLHKVTGERVAVLIDEHDAPVRDVLDDITRAKKNLAVLHGFYGSLKTLVDQDLVSTVFVTGVTKLVLGSGFSGFNGYSDFTFEPEYNAICGFTPDEFLNCFEPYLPDLLDRFKSGGHMPAEGDRESLIKMIFDCYDGYSWDGENRVLNPGSIIEMLGSKELDTRGFNSGTPTFLLKVLKHEKNADDFHETAVVRKNTLNSTDIENFKLDSVLFHAGYLTIDKKLNSGEYLLKRPNKEVRRAWDDALLRFFSRIRPKIP